MKDSKLKTYALALFAMFLWGSAFPVLKLTYESFNIAADDYYSKLLVAGIRFLMAGIIVFIYMYITKKEQVKYFKSNILFIIILGLVTTTINYVFFYIGVGNTSGVKSAIMQSASTFSTVILASVFLGEKFTNKKLLAVILGFLGVILSNLNKGFDLNFTLQGEGFMLISALSQSLGVMLVKRKKEPIPSMVLTSGQMLTGSVILLVLGIYGKNPNLTLELKGILLLLYSAMISSLAFTIWYYLLTKNPASEITMLRLFIPIFGTILSSIVLGESLTYYVVLGLIFVVLGVYVINKPTVRPRS